MLRRVVPYSCFPCQQRIFIMKNPIFTALLTLFIAACDNGLSVDITVRPKDESQSSNSVSVDPVKQSATLHTSIEPNTPKTADWTPLFKYLETDGCASDNRPPELARLIGSMEAVATDPKTGRIISSGKIAVPKGYEHAVGRVMDDHSGDFVKLSVRGTYHGLPVKELVSVARGDSVTHYLVLDVPLAEAKDKLRRVRYAIPKTLSADRRVALKLFEEMGGGKADAHEVASFLKGYQAYVDSYDSNDYGEEMKGKVVLACDGGF